MHCHLMTTTRACEPSAESAANDEAVAISDSFECGRDDDEDEDDEEDEEDEDKSRSAAEEDAAAALRFLDERPTAGVAGSVNSAMADAESSAEDDEDEDDWFTTPSRSSSSSSRLR